MTRAATTMGGGAAGSSPPPYSPRVPKWLFVSSYMREILRVKKVFIQLNYIARFCLVRFLAISADASQGRDKKKGDERRERVPGEQSRSLGRKKKPHRGTWKKQGQKKKKEPRPNEQGMSLCGVFPPPISFLFPPPMPLPRERKDWSGETGYTGRINERGEKEGGGGC